jgi:hypothetical protein
MYTRNADRLMLFWRLCESRRASDLVWRRSAQAALLAPSSAVEGALPVGNAPLTPALVRLDPMFDPLQNDRRFQKLVVSP